MPRFSKSAYALRVGVSRIWIDKLIKSGKIDLFLNGKRKEIESDQADPIVKFKPAGRSTSTKHQKAGAKRKGKNTENSGEVGELPELTKNTSLEDLERIKAYEAARKLKIANDLIEGKYYKIEDINERTFNVFRKLRDGVLSIKDRVAMKCRTAETDHESRQILDNETHSILNGIVDGYKDLSDENLKKKLLSLLI